jgi:hypothetical protein
VAAKSLRTSSFNEKNLVLIKKKVYDRELNVYLVLFTYASLLGLQDISVVPMPLDRMQITTAFDTSEILPQSIQGHLNYIIVEMDDLGPSY